MIKQTAIKTIKQWRVSKQCCMQSEIHFLNSQNVYLINQTKYIIKQQLDTIVASKTY